MLLFLYNKELAISIVAFSETMNLLQVESNIEEFVYLVNIYINKIFYFIIGFQCKYYGIYIIH